MRDRFSFLFLAISGAVFVATGLVFVFAPGLVGAIRENAAGASADAINDVRTVYGALELALGIFFVLCARRPRLYEAGFLCALVVGGSMAVARFAGFAFVVGTPVAHLAYGALDVVRVAL